MWASLGAINLPAPGSTPIFSHFEDESIEIREIKALSQGHTTIMAWVPQKADSNTQRQVLYWGVRSSE